MILVCVNLLHTVIYTYPSMPICPTNHCIISSINQSIVHFIQPHCKKNINPPSPQPSPQPT
jgi:hypothetical protein